MRSGYHENEPLGIGLLPRGEAATQPVCHRTRSNVRRGELCMAVDQETLITQLENCLSSVVLGKRDVIRLCTVALLAGEHVLLEDVPGVGKDAYRKSPGQECLW